MSIDAISVTTVSVTSLTVQFRNTEITEPEEITEAVTIEPQPEETTPVETEETIEEKTRGVLRLLQEGHFKGVADVRLRINFFEEIQEIEAQQLQDTAEEGLETLSESAQAASKPLTESGLLDEDQSAAMDEFWAHLESAPVGEGETPPGEPLIENLQNRLNSLMSLLNPTSAVPEETKPDQPDDGLQIQLPETPAIEPAPAENSILDEDPTSEEPEEAPNPLLGLVQDFQEAIQLLIDKLQSDLTTARALPEISESRGNGKAYTKFLGMYEDMLTATSTDANDTESLNVEESAETADSSKL